MFFKTRFTKTWINIVNSCRGEWARGGWVSVQGKGREGDVCVRLHNLVEVNCLSVV